MLAWTTSKRQTQITAIIAWNLTQRKLSNICPQLEQKKPSRDRGLQHNSSRLIFFFKNSNCDGDPQSNLWWWFSCPALNSRDQIDLMSLHMALWVKGSVKHHAELLLMNSSLLWSRKSWDHSCDVTAPNSLGKGRFQKELLCFLKYQKYLTKATRKEVSSGGVS